MSIDRIRDILQSVISSREVGYEEHGERYTFAVQPGVMDEVRQIAEVLDKIETLVQAAQAAVCGAQPLGVDKGEVRFHPSVASLREALVPFSDDIGSVTAP